MLTRSGWTPPAAGLASSSRMLEALRLAESCLPQVSGANELATMLFYIDCEVFSTIGRPITDLGWTRGLSVPLHVEMDIGGAEQQLLDRWFRHPRPELPQSDVTIEGTTWLSGIEVKLIRHAVVEFCKFGKRERGLVGRLRTQFEAAPAASPSVAAPWDALLRAALDERIGTLRRQRLVETHGEDAPPELRAAGEPEALAEEVFRSLTAAK